MLTLISYDVVDNRRRTKVSNLLNDFGARAALYRICQECAPKIMILGTGVVTEDPEVYVV